MNLSIREKLFVANSSKANSVVNNTSAGKPDRVLLKKPIYADSISFTSINKPTKKEKQKVAQLQQLLEKKLLPQLKSKIKDISALVRLKAYESILQLAPLEYTKKEKQLLKKAQDLALADMKKYNNGQDVERFIEDLKKQGFVFCFAEDMLPEDLWTDEDFLESWKMDEDDIEEQLESPEPLSVNMVLKKDDSAEIHYERKDCKALVLFNKRPPSPETFWHEWFHYCQKKAGLFCDRSNKNETDGSRFAKRELETYEFIINNRIMLKTSDKTIKLDTAIWNSYRDLYNYEKEYEESKALESDMELETYVDHLFDPSGGIDTLQVLRIKDDTVSENGLEPVRERSLINKLLKRHQLDINSF